jgi:type II secretory pathway predicted ATPase ExeA
VSSARDSRALILTEIGVWQLQTSSPPLALLIDLSALLNFGFDSRDLLTLWLVGLPPLARHLRMQQHAPLAMRIVHYIHLEPFDHSSAPMIDHAFKAAGATQTVLADPLANSSSVPVAGYRASPLICYIER